MTDQRQRPRRNRRPHEQARPVIVRLSPAERTSIAAAQDLEEHATGARPSLSRMVAELVRRGLTTRDMPHDSSQSECRPAGSR